MKGGENVWTICWEKWEPFCPIRRVYSSYRNWHRCSSRKPAGESQGQQTSAEKTESGEGGGDINMLLRIQELMGAMQNNDEDAKLLLALRPHLKDQRQKKAGSGGETDEIVRGIQCGAGKRTATRICYKAIPHKERLATLHAICLQISRHISQKCS